MSIRRKRVQQFLFALMWAPLGALLFTLADPSDPKTTIATVVFGTLGIACMITPIPLLCRWAKTPPPPAVNWDRELIELTKHGDTWR